MRCAPACCSSHNSFIHREQRRICSVCGWRGTGPCPFWAGWGDCDIVASVFAACRSPLILADIAALAWPRGRIATTMSINSSIDPERHMQIQRSKNRSSWRCSKLLDRLGRLCRCVRRQDNVLAHSLMYNNRLEQYTITEMRTIC